MFFLPSSRLPKWMAPDASVPHSEQHKVPVWLISVGAMHMFHVGVQARTRLDAMRRFASGRVLAEAGVPEILWDRLMAEPFHCHGSIGKCDPEVNEWEWNPTGPVSAFPMDEDEDADCSSQP